MGEKTQGTYSVLRSRITETNQQSTGRMKESMELSEEALKTNLSVFIRYFFDHFQCHKYHTGNYQNSTPVSVSFPLPISNYNSLNVARMYLEGGDIYVYNI